MPISPSPQRGAKAQQPARRPDPPASLWPRLALIGAVAIVVIVICVLPASLIARFLPPTLQAGDFSGSIWHGSAGKITANGRPAGAVEWSLHPTALLGLHLVADVHWVKGGFVLDGSAAIAHTHLAASNIAGGGPITDLQDLGIGAGWRGSVGVRIAQLTADLAGSGAILTSAIGSVTVSDVSTSQIASGDNLGGYALTFNDPTTADGADMSAALTDTGGPLAVDAAIHFSMKTRTGLLSGTLEERADAPPSLRSQLENLARLHARDASGRLPIDLEFTF